QFMKTLALKSCGLARIDLEQK
ncbi:MAG: guanylate kinase, partial [Lacticaseibacillus paracasei]